MGTLPPAISLCRFMRVMAITAAALGLALGLAYAAFAQPVHPAANPMRSPVQQAPTLLTPMVYMPLIMVPAAVRFAIIGYDCCINGRGQFEHIHFRNFGAGAVNITGWRINSPATGDSYTFPVASAPPFTSTGHEMTLNTNYAADADNIYIFNWNINKDEWPNAGGVAYLFDAGDILVSTCHYTPTAGDNGNANCQ